MSTSCDCAQRNNGRGQIHADIACLAKLTGHPEIVDQPGIYILAVKRWAIGIPGVIEPFGTRDDDEVEFIQALCRENVCGKHQDGACKLTCEVGVIIAVKARMATEDCLWAGQAGEIQGPRWTTTKAYSTDPGSKLLKMYATAGVPHCQQCIALAAQMDSWGPDGCRERLDEIIGDILPRARKWLTDKRPWAHKLLSVTGTEDVALRLAIRQKVLAAISAADENPSERTP